jgi:branched-chain amino acid transport system permease protein
MALYAAWWVSGSHHYPYVAGAIAAIAFAVLIGLAFERVAVRPMTEAPRVTVAVATIGLLSLALAVESVIFGPSPRRIPAPLSGAGISIAGVIVSPSQLLAALIVVVIAVALTAFLRYTDFGLGVLAAAQDATAARLMGVSQRRVSAFIWGTAGALSAIAGLLIMPTIGYLTPGALAGLFIGGLTAALVGGLNSLSGAFVGGFVVGTVEALIKTQLVSVSIPGITSLGLFAVIAAVLLLRPQGLLGGRA